MKNLFIWLPQGRLGNLIFQYQAIHELSGSATVLAMDSEFFDAFEKPRRFLVLRCFKRFRWRLQVLWTNLFLSLANNNWIGTIEPGRHIVLDSFTWESVNVHWKKGHLANVFLVKGFFQTPQYLDPLPKLKRKALNEAERRFISIPEPNRVAIHMRFGDYRNWPVFGVPGSACLPDSYYVKGLAIIRKAVPAAHFLVFSDEPDRARAILEPAGVAEKMHVIEGGTAQSDFALIASCSHAIISASTFSWWAASLIRNPNRLLIAPKYWAGFRRKTWYPSGIESSHFMYIDPISD